MVAVGSADEAASIVLDEALKASNQGTFAVGGMLFNNKTREILIEMHNNVLRPSSNGTGLSTWDPTAHGECQIVYWYYENKTRYKLPNAEDLTLVTSLDPCVMCTGALLTAGFNVGVVANDTFAGINYDKKYDFPDLPDNLRTLIGTKFGYYAIGVPSSDPPKYVRDYAGPDSLPFKSDRISSKHLAACSAIFNESVNEVRNISNQQSGKSPESMIDPATLPNDSPIKIAFQKIYRDAFKIKINNFRFPDKKIIDELERVANNQDGRGNAVSFIDPFGNLILCMPGQEEVSPIRVPFMEVVQNYSKTRWNLLNDPETSSIAANTLTHPKYGTFLYLYAPDPDTSTTLMAFGAYGSTMEGPIPHVFPTNLQYVYPPKAGDISDVMY
ncbi:MAG: nucleoside deaminase, partial [Nitrososphaera sp.]